MTQQPQQPRLNPAHHPRAAGGIRPHDVEQGAGRGDGSGAAPAAARATRGYMGIAACLGIGLN